MLNAAYNDAQGVTAAFNLNLLTRINRELGADFDLDAFAHRAFFNAAASRIEMHLVSRVDQEVQIGGPPLPLRARTRPSTPRIPTSTASRISRRSRATRALRSEQVWVDDARLFSVHCLRVDGD